MFKYYQYSNLNFQSSNYFFFILVKIIEVYVTRPVKIKLEPETEVLQESEKTK